MLYLEIPGNERWDERKEEFVYSKPTTLQLEHSLVSLSKWESIFNKPYLSTQLTEDETIEYIKCMTITQNVNPEVYNRITTDMIVKINTYINAPMTATWFSEEEQKKSKFSRTSEIVTAESIYYWMIAYSVPMECQKWHLNRLLTLIRVCEIKNRPAKKVPLRDIYAKNRALNEARKKKFNSHG